MAALVLRRFAAMLAVLFGLAVIVFVLQAVIPSDPARAMVGASASKEAVEAKRHELGYDQPLPAQFADYMGRLAQGDLQSSLRTRNEVVEDLRAFAPATFELAFAAMFLAAIGGLGLGLLLAGGGRAGKGIRLLLIGGASIPAFLTGLLLIVVFYSWLGWLPASGRVGDNFVVPDGPTNFLVIDSILNGTPDLTIDALQHLLLPAITLALLPTLAIARTLATSLDAVQKEDYVRTARAKGLKERAVLLKHALRNASGPALTMGGLQVGLMLGSIVVVERIFAWPGIGLYIDQSIAYSDFPAICGATLLLGATYVFLNFLVDLAQAWADPRIRTV